MEFEVIEQTYPEDFRKDLTKELSEHLNKRDSVVFIGMRRVGISNYLRFFLYHKKLKARFTGKPADFGRQLGGLAHFAKRVN